MHESHLYYTISYVKYDVVGAHRPKRLIYAYNVHIRYRLRYIMELHLTWSRCRRCGSHWPGPCRPHCSSRLVILGPSGWSVLRRDSQDALSLVLAYVAAPNMSGDSLIRGKSGRTSGAWATVIEPAAYKVIESDGRAEHGHCRVWQ